MPSEPAPDLGPDKLSLLVVSGTYERVHYALVLASGGAAMGKPVTLFFTGEALLALRGAAAGGAPGWRLLPAAAGPDGGAVDDDYRERRVAGFEELLSSCIELGVRFIACEMGLRAMRLQRSALLSEVPIEVAGVVTFLGDASAKGAMLVL